MASKYKIKLRNFFEEAWESFGHILLTLFSWPIAWKLFHLVKLRHYEKSVKFEKISHLFWQNSCFYSVASKQPGNFSNFLWPFYKSWTLCTFYPSGSGNLSCWVLLLLLLFWLFCDDFLLTFLLGTAPFIPCCWLLLGGGTLTLKACW